jgi:hypothetical protein
MRIDTPGASRDLSELLLTGRAAAGSL